MRKAARVAVVSSSPVVCASVPVVLYSLRQGGGAGYTSCVSCQWWCVPQHGSHPWRERNQEAEQHADRLISKRRRWLAGSKLPPTLSLVWLAAVPAGPTAVEAAAQPPPPPQPPRQATAPGRPPAPALRRAAAAAAATAACRAGVPPAAQAPWHGGAADPAPHPHWAPLHRCWLPPQAPLAEEHAAPGLRRAPQPPWRAARLRRRPAAGRGPAGAAAAGCLGRPPAPRGPAGRASCMQACRDGGQARCLVGSSAGANRQHNLQVRACDASRTASPQGWGIAAPQERRDKQARLPLQALCCREAAGLRRLRSFTGMELGLPGRRAWRRAPCLLVVHACGARRRRNLGPPQRALQPAAGRSPAALSPCRPSSSGPASRG